MAKSHVRSSPRCLLLTKTKIWNFPSDLFHIEKRFKVQSVSRSVMSNLWPHGLWCTRLLCRWDSPDKSTRVGSHSLLQGIFLTQGQNPGLLHCRHILYPLSHQGSSLLERRIFDISLVRYYDRIIFPSDYQWDMWNII